MRKVPANLQSGCPSFVHRVVAYENIAAEWTPEQHFLAWVRSEDERAGVAALQAAGLANLFWLESDGVEEGDVVVAHASAREVVVLLRESDAHHALFMTNRCNSYCLMCSQPPTAVDDGWLVAEAIAAVQHLRRAPAVLGLTGGEPLLLGEGLRQVLDAVAKHHPQTTVEVLTNGRLLSNPGTAAQLLDGLALHVRWLVPLYGHADFLHDFVVQARGAFDETLAGLLTLQAYRQEIQLRVVLIEPTLENLPNLADFVGRNLPFVREVALMGCEPIGFALANRAQCEVDLAEWGTTLEQAARTLRRHSIPVLFMNTPLCALPPSIWVKAHRSISDWKNVYAPECEGCTVKHRCAGLFAWHEKGWKPAPLKSVKTREAIA